MSDHRYRVLAVCAHPVQYMSPIMRRMAQHPQLDLKVAYCSLRGAEASHDSEFGTTVQWDVPLLDGYDWVELLNHGSGAESFFGLNNPEIWSLIRGGKFDAVLCYTGYVRASFWIAYLAARVSKTAFLFGTDASTLASRDASRWKVLLKRMYWPALFSLADEVIVPSNATRELILSLGIPGERVTLTPFSVDNDWWSARASEVDREAIRKSWAVSPGQIVILFCAKLQSWKRPLDLLRAFGRLSPAERLKTVLVYAGDGHLRVELESEAASLGVGDRVRFLGFVNQSQLPGVYAAADLMVLPSEYEPFAVVVNEASCCGCPVVVSDRVGAGRDLVAPVNPEFIYPCGDVAALAQLIRNVLSNPGQLPEYGRAARRRMDSWSPRENIAAAVEAIHRAVTHVRQTPYTPGAFLTSSNPAPRRHPTDSPKRLIIYSHFFVPSVGGVETIVLDLAKGLAECYLANGSPEFDIALVTQTPSGNFRDAQLPFQVIRQPSATELLRLVRQADVVHVAGAAIPPVICGLIALKPVVIEHHGFQTICPTGQLFLEPEGIPCPGHFMAGAHRYCLRCTTHSNWGASFRLWLLTFFRRFLSQRVKVNITPTDWLAGQLQLSRRQTVHHGLPASDALVHISSAHEIPVVGFLGRLVTSKGVRLLLDAAQILKKEHRQFDLLIAGDGPERDPLESYAAELGLGEQVRFLGRLSQSELAETLAGVDIIVVPSLGGEVFGMVLAESMLRGLGVVASDLGSFLEVLGDCGKVFKAGDAADLAKRIAELLDDPAASQRLGLAARQRALDFLSLRRMIDEHAGIYRSLTLGKAR